MTTDYRNELRKLMLSTLADEKLRGDWYYDAVRPMPVPSSWSEGQKVVGDCSKGVQFLCKWAGIKDPMYEDFGPYGNSTTLCLRLQHLLTTKELMIGDIITFGENGNEHAAMVLETGDDPLLWSFGHQGAPNTYRLSQDRRVRQFLRNPLPTYVPTKADKLRSKQGYFAWVAWKLGEGDWRPYGKADKSVRPNVPKRIPLNWWKRYTKFMLNRKKGNKPTTAAIR